MPTFKHVTLNIHTPQEPPVSTESFSWANTAHAPLPEYGNHRLRNTDKITSYIPSTTNSPFAISITILDSYQPKNEGDERESLAAYVYFDGRQKEETATLLRRGVETWISSRWVEVKEGELAEREFVFKEVGLESFLSGLDLSKSERESNAKNGTRKGVNRRHSMPAKMKAKTDDDDEEDADVGKKESVGQIRVDLFRVRCEGPVRRGVWGGMFKDSRGDEDDEFGGGVDVSHTAGLSDPKPLDRETVSTQSVSHLDPEGVVYASFVFFYRGERQLKKMGLIKPPAPTRADSLSAAPPNKSKKQDFAAMASALESLIAKGSEKNGASERFNDFRDGNNGITNGNDLRRKKVKKIPGLDGRDDDVESLVGDELARDERDSLREMLRSEEDVRLEEELIGGVDRIKLKRSHSTSSLRDSGSKDKAATPPPDFSVNNKAKTFATPGKDAIKKSESVHANGHEPETPLKKRRGSGDVDVKSPARGLGFGMQTTPMTGFGGKVEFGGVLGGGMEMEEEIL
ncbi:hypothetical protein HOY80DRAFT_1010051 [Tuber brumale]|nr:hypothetical protein HOY80DRAFT_1010051 [Tuber brumale]